MCLQHIDQIMSSHGKQIMQAVTLILEADHSIEVKEQVKQMFINTLLVIAGLFSVLLTGRYHFL